MKFLVELKNLRALIKSLDSLENSEILIHNTLLNDNIHESLLALQSTINFTESQKQGRIIINYNIDEVLDVHRKDYSGIEDLLNTVANQLSLVLPKNISSLLNVIYFPQLGYLISIPSDIILQDPAQFSEILKWEAIFETSTNSYFKSDEMREMDGYYEDLHELIKDREIEIIQQLKVKLLPFKSLLISLEPVCGDIDRLIALTITAIQNNYVRPTICEDNILKIKEGRHPIYELAVPTFVANDTNVEGGSGDTGKTSGKLLRKSVYTTQVALIVYLDHIGSYIPAKDATIGLTDRILTRLMSQESVSKQSSTFMIDLNQIYKALDTMTRRSLLIIDEFGKGTDYISGTSRFSAVIQYLIDLGPEAPKAIVTTHFYELLKNKILNERVLNSIGSGNYKTHNLKTGEVLIEVGISQQFIPAEYLSEDTTNSSPEENEVQGVCFNTISDHIQEPVFKALMKVYHMNILISNNTREEDKITYFYT